MIQGTTPDYIYELPFESSFIKEAQIVFSQDDQAVVTKKTKDCTIGEKTIGTTLTQAETFKFDNDKFVEIQLRVLTLGGDALATFPEKIPLVKCLNEEVLV